MNTYGLIRNWHVFSCIGCIAVCLLINLYLYRSPTDMQYAFAYYYYVINKHKAKAPSISSFLENEIDTNRDGVIDDNEMRTLALLIQNKPMTEVSDLDTVWNCTNASSQHQDTSYATTKGVHNGLSTFRSFPTIKVMLLLSL